MDKGYNTNIQFLIILPYRMTNLAKKERTKGLYVLGTMYPEAVGGMEIFNYYFLKYQLDNLKKNDYYWATNGLAGHEKNHLKVHVVRPISIFYPLQLFGALLKHGSNIGYVYTGYARQPWVIPFFYAMLFRLFRKPYIVTIHSGGKPIWKPGFPYRYYFKNADALIGVSETICKEYSDLLSGKRVQFIPPLIPFRHAEKSRDQLKSEFGLSPENKVLLFVGTLKAMKNPDKVLQAFSRLIERNQTNNLKIIMVGGGEMLEDLRAWTKEKKLNEHIFLPGLIKRESIPDFFGMADGYIISSDFEGTSVSLLEAMFNKLPIIAADSPGLNEILQSNENALLYPAHDIERLAQCMVKITGDSELASRLAEKGNKDFIEKYSYNIMIKKYDELFNNHLNEN